MRSNLQKNIWDTSIYNLKKFGKMRTIFILFISGIVITESRIIHKYPGQDIIS